MKELLSKVKACLFDMDGTIINSMGIWKDIDVEFFSKYNIEMPEDFQAVIEGLSIVEIANYVDENFNFPLTVEEMIDEWNDMAYDQYATKVGYKESAREFLLWCRTNNIKTGVATSNSTYLYNAVSNNLGICDLIDTVVTGEDVDNGKPNPECYLRVAKNLGVDPSECVIFEDLVLGILAGRGAGMKTCAMYDEYSLYQDDAKRKEADYYYNSFSDILALMQAD